MCVNFHFKHLSNRTYIVFLKNCVNLPTFSEYLVMRIGLLGQIGLEIWRIGLNWFCGEDRFVKADRSRNQITLGRSLVLNWFGEKQFG